MLSRAQICIRHQCLITKPKALRCRPAATVAAPAIDITEDLSSPEKAQSPRAKTIPSASLSHYWDTRPPTVTQLAQAERFFLAHDPVLLFSAEKFRTVDFTSVPEVAFFGRSNVGKSSLLNAIMGKPICFVSKVPGRTRTMNAFAVGGEDPMGNKGRVTVFDMPGYGQASHEEWGKEIMKYLVGRRELRRAFVIVDPLHGLKDTDAQLLTLLRHNAIPHQLIMSKVDRMLLPNSKKPSEAVLETRLANLREFAEDLKKQIQPLNDGPPALGEIIGTAAENDRGRKMSTEKRGKLGINAVRWAIIAATGLDKTKAFRP